jgi:hypothetical protein|tara:strand:- start:2597 stop:2920 length:324 start_codon:yes stop_codon:yes gene_type:complete
MSQEDTKCCEFCLPESSYKPEKIDLESFALPATCKFFIEGLDYCDEEPSNTDCNCFGPRGRDCIVCYTCFTPIGFVIDSITIPFRVTYCSIWCCVKKCKKENTVEDN